MCQFNVKAHVFETTAGTSIPLYKIAMFHNALVKGTKFLSKATMTNFCFGKLGIELKSKNFTNYP